MGQVYFDYKDEPGKVREMFGKSSEFNP